MFNCKKKIKIKKKAERRDLTERKRYEISGKKHKTRSRSSSKRKRKQKKTFFSQKTELEDEMKTMAILARLLTAAAMHPTNRIDDEERGLFAE